MQNNLSNFNKSNIRKLKFILIASFLLYFFSNTLIYANSNKNDSDYLIPIGNIVQIDAQLKNIVVRNKIANSPFNCGDEILSINDVAIDSYESFSNTLLKISNDQKISVLVLRGQSKFSIETTKEHLAKINIINLLSGFATLTYIDPANGNFGAVAHPLSVGPNRSIPIQTGNIYTTDNLIIQKSFKGHVGFISAKKKDTVGKFNINNDFGIKGKMIGLDTSNLKAYKVASLDEVELGKAQVILQTSCSGCETFNIEIVDIQKQRSPQAKTFKIKVTDKELLNKTGGIVQGMSGTPIIQNNKIIGAISHAIENDPSTGYAVFIQWMLYK